MKSIISAMAIVILAHSLQSQAPLSPESIEPYAASFRLENNNITGPGATMMKSLIEDSQFVTLGELHGSEQISRLTKAMLPLLTEAGFRHFAIEVGPHSAQKLSELSTPASNTLANLKVFNAAYTVTAGDETAIPIPFFDGESDAEFLATARGLGMDLWGLDQEFYFSPIFLTDELAKTEKGSPQYESILALKAAAQQAMFTHFMAEVKEEIDAAYVEIKKDPAVLAYFEAFPAENARAQQMITDMTISWDIYINWRNGSHDDRISYILQNFETQYQKAQALEKQPKVFTKIGGLHAREIISNGAYDIGVYAQELADNNNTEATSIGVWKPFETGDDGTVINNLERYASSYKRYKAFLPLANEDAFTIIDLQGLERAIERGKIAMPTNGDYHKIRRLLDSYDYLIMLPVDSEPTPNR